MTTNATRGEADVTLAPAAEAGASAEVTPPATATEPAGTARKASQGAGTGKKAAPAAAGSSKKATQAAAGTAKKASPAAAGAASKAATTTTTDAPDSARKAAPAAAGSAGKAAAAATTKDAPGTARKAAPGAGSASKKAVTVKKKAAARKGIRPDKVARAERAAKAAAEELPPRPPWSRRRRVAWLSALAVAVLYAAGAGLWYWQSTGTPAVAGGQLRDQALAAATREVTDLNTVNYKAIGAAQSRWLADTTGSLHAQIVKTNASAKTQIKKVQTSSAAKVTSAAVTALNRQAGTATVIAVVQVQQVAVSGGVNTVINRYICLLARHDGRWQISSLKPA